MVYKIGVKVDSSVVLPIPHVSLPQGYSMPFTINNTLVTFSLAEFDRIARECHSNINLNNSSLTHLRQGLDPASPPILKQEISLRISRILPAKRQKYKKVIKYVAFHCPAISQNIVINAIPNGRIPHKYNFQTFYRTMDTNTDYVDLMYGIAAARGYPPYQLATGAAMQCDDYNNASGIGNGLAFSRLWDGSGLLNVTRQEATDSIRRGTALGRVRSDHSRQVFAHGLLASRYNPVEALDMPKERVLKDTHKNLAHFRASMPNNRTGRRLAEQHYVAHAKMLKGIRRACKGGIAMVASSPLYQAVHAKVHFVLDGLGDLGVMARKDVLANKDNYVAITSSELAFCCRYWNDPAFPLSQVVKFYVNGARVYAPWEADWTVPDSNGVNVYSNQEAWLRYRYASIQTLGTAKMFPRF